MDTARDQTPDGRRPILDELYESYQREERRDLVVAAVRKEVDRWKDEIENGN